jgi:glycosyltransferase involved in cell wall biosynthesis
MPPEPAPVSVIIPAYRAAETIGRALESVARQTLKPAQVVVVDDGSDDGTFEAAQACAASLAPVRLQVIRQENLGAGSARNRAVLAADQPILAFLDADDEWLPEKLAVSLARMEAHGLDLVAHNGLIVGAGGETLNDCAKRFRDARDPFVGLYRKGYIDTCTVLAKRDQVLAAGGFDTRLANAQDFEMWLALLGDPGRRFEVFDGVLSRYHLRAGSVMSHTDRRLDCCMAVARAHAPELKVRPGSAAASLVYRILAVHWEAITAHLAAGRLVRMAVQLAKLPFRLVTGFRALSAPGNQPRPDFLRAGKPERSSLSP